MVVASIEKSTENLVRIFEQRDMKSLVATGTLGVAAYSLLNEMGTRAAEWAGVSGRGRYAVVAGVAVLAAISWSETAAMWGEPLPEALSGVVALAAMIAVGSAFWGLLSGSGIGEGTVLSLSVGDRIQQALPAETASDGPRNVYQA